MDGQNNNKWTILQITYEMQEDIGLYYLRFGIYLKIKK
jgi:hypothetical protein